MSVFDDHAENYAQILDDTVGWIGQEHDFFVDLKARLLVRLLRQYWGKPKEAVILDVGCGVGLIDRRLAGSVGGLHGIDISEESIRVAAQNCPAGEFLSYDGKHIPYPANTFDYTFAVCVLHHVPPPDWPGFLAEMARVLKPGGVAVIIEHNPTNPVTRYIVHHHPLDHGAVMLPAGNGERLILQTGLEVIKKRYITFVPFRIPWLEQIERFLGWIPLGAQYFIAAVKR